MKRIQVLLTGIAALTPALALEAPAWGEDTGPSTFQPPASDLILTRTVWRSLNDGQEIVARRRYAIRFVPNKDGYHLYGELIEATVDAPPLLASLAELERRRPDNGMFPIAIDRQGRILSSKQKPAPSAANQQAGIAAQALVGQTGLDPQEKRQIQEQIPRILAAAGMAGSNVPPELFDPTAGPHREQRVLALPGGGEGRVDVQVNVQRLTRQSLPRSVERTVTTELEGSRRVSREVWTFAPPN